MFSAFADFFDKWLGGDDEVSFEFEVDTSSLVDLSGSLSLVELEGELDALEAFAAGFGITDMQDLDDDDLQALLELSQESHSYGVPDDVELSPEALQAVQVLADNGVDVDMLDDGFLQFITENGLDIEDMNDIAAANVLYYEAQYDLAAQFSNLAEAMEYMEGVSAGILELQVSGDIFYVWRVYK